MARTRSDYMRKTIKDLRTGTSFNGSSCPLDTKNLGVITENDHLTNNCLCSLCTCGQHTCPNTYFHEPYPKSIYNSDYRKNFNKKPISKTEKFKYPSNFLPLQPVDLQSTSQHFYQGNVIDSNLNYKPLRPQSAPKTPLGTRTTYNNSYLLWDVGAFPHMKQYHIKHHNSDLRLNNSTIYSQSFEKFHEKKDIKKVRDNGLNDKSSINFNFPITSTHRSNFKDFSKDAVIEKKKLEKSQTIAKTIPIKNQYLSTTKKDFVAKDAEIDHRTVNRVIKKERLKRGK